MELKYFKNPASTFLKYPANKRIGLNLRKFFLLQTFVTDWLQDLWPQHKSKHNNQKKKYLKTSNSLFLVLLVMVQQWVKDLCFESKQCIPFWFICWEECLVSIWYWVMWCPGVIIPDPIFPIVHHSPLPIVQRVTCPRLGGCQQVCH